jgi:hypothetical protein
MSFFEKILPFFGKICYNINVFYLVRKKNPIKKQNSNNINLK